MSKWTYNRATFNALTIMSSAMHVQHFGTGASLHSKDIYSVNGWPLL